ncbi:MAG: hypothetical protein V1778_03815 [bacterium]
MKESKSTTREKNNRHALQKLVGAVAIAGVTYAAERFVESRKSKKETRRKE